MIVHALNARNGDAAIISVASGHQSVIGLVDGGPVGAFDASLRDALAQFSIDESGGVLDFVVISHCDSDHIGGVLKMLKRGYDVAAVYFNTPTAFPAFDVSTSSDGANAGLEDLVAAALRRSAPTVLPASINQGNALVSELVRNGGRDRLNSPENRRLLTGDRFERGGDLRFSVLGPSLGRLNELFAKWERVTPASATELDGSITNLASLTLLIEHSDQKALFTGDAIEHDVLEGIDAVTPGLAHVDLLKVPHHGSNSATSPGSVEAGTGLIERVTADHYVVSADGRSTNPSFDTLKRIVDVAVSRPSDHGRRVVWLPGVAKKGLISSTHYETAVDDFIAYNESMGAPLRVMTGTGGPLVIDLDRGLV